MKHQFSMGSVLAAITIAAVTPLTAFEPQAEFNFSGGWREDHLRSFITTNVDTSTDLVKGAHLNIWQIGLDGFVAPQFCECGSLWNNFVVKGSAYWGWINDGVYQHTITDVPSVGFTTIDRGDIFRGHTWDYDVGIGYLYPVMDCVRLGPTFGYSYNKLTYKAENVIGVIDNPTNPLLVPPMDGSKIDHFSYFDEGLVFISRWKGLWAGVDATIDMCEWMFTFSYEYHWGQWEGKFNAVPDNLTDDIHFSDKRKSNSARGQVGFIGANYAFSECFNIGLGVKYENFHAAGREVPQVTPDPNAKPPVLPGFPGVGGPANEVDKVKTTWSSVQVIVDLGVAF